MHYPFYQQLYSMDCGAACVKMIACSMGKDVEYSYIQNQCRIGSEGVSIKGICNALDSIGIRTLAGKVTLPDLIEKANLPCILHWQQNHFVVLYCIKKGKKRKYIIADPAKEIVEYEEQEFINAWLSTCSDGRDKGSVILVEPALNFQNKHYPKAAKKIRGEKIQFLINYYKRYGNYFFQIIFGLIISSLILLVAPFLTQSIVDIGIGNKSINFILLVLFGQMILLLGRTAIDYIQTRLLIHIGARINLSLLSDFFIKLMRLPMNFFDTRLLGDILQRIKDHERVQEFLTSEIIGLSFSLLSFMVFGIVMCIYDASIFFVFLIFSLSYAGWLLLFLKKRRRLDFKYFDEQAESQNKTYQLINSVQETKLNNAEDKKRWEWEDTQADLFSIVMDTLKLQQNQNAGGLFITESRNIVITVMAATSVINGDLSLGMMMAIQFILGELSSPIERLITSVYEWQDVSISLDRIQEIHSQVEDNSGRTITEFIGMDKDIHIKNLSFQYPGVRETMVLRNINLDIKEGETTAIVGTSGSGKTTLIKLLLGFYHATDGVIKIGDANIENINLKWWYNQCGVVMQNGYIYSDTISSNIAMSDSEPDVDRLEYASKVSNIYSFISQLPLKYNTALGENGQGLSQGQKQRILIARAVYKNPAYLFLDEATNSLDANTEKAIVEELNNFYKGKTVIVVAHRLSTVKRANQIVVIDNGEIVEVGKHQDLIKLKGKYYNLIKNQLELGD